jgi:two-component sensor histidine kinase
MAAGGETWLYAVAPLWPGRAWMLVGAERDALYAGALRGAAAPIIAPFLMLPVAVAMAYFALNRLVVRHVVYLARLTRAYGAGRLRLRPRGLANAPRELAMLADDLARMAERLEDRQEALVRAAENNRFLLREVHHRVKNNLQMIVSLLNLQAGRARTDGEREGLDRIRARVMAVAAVHGAIYASDAMDRVPLDALIRRVAEAQGGMPAGAGRPRLSLDLDPVEDTPERATPLALLANEALTNAIKYAAAEDGNPPRIEVALRARPEGGYAFSVANDVTAEVDATDEGAVGARLIDGFARQIGASLQRRTLDGRFRLDLVAPPPPETEAEPAPEGPRNA